VAAFIETLTDDEAAVVLDGMKDVAVNGLPAARHLRGEIYEVRADSDRHAFRLLFAQETKFILLSLSAFTKKARKTPPEEIIRAETRLKDWRSRGQR
jgi:phage-related protein